ncbi:hypothetical protein DAPPUDRAFT_107032 [Daphnia pulex]|uniref:Ionotropic glutamate receptor C-terminal domain-containing protein n=1 Tax=Daphnia pulex TaxID=6669 RepID=E9GVR4_DAPPU|nr:hypothetical protein DAPPUDRAFT_107032 [Daphnia pulex]|eukprot:EFX76455.1 hypothetical protein DAPPUDRAFT_107032 [Daphnia pulex]
MGQLVRNEVDMSISFGPWFYSRSMAVDMTGTVILDDISIVVPYPKHNTDAAGYLYAFSYLTWGFTFASFSLSTLFIWIVAHVGLQQKGEQKLGIIMVYVLSVCLGQGGFLRSYSLASRIIQGAFLLVLLVITYAFTGIVTSMITTPKYQFVVRSIEEVANNDEIMPLIIEESSTHVAFEVKMF